MSEKYRNEHDEPNSKCDVCDTPVWVCRGVYTTYHGYKHLWNCVDKKDVCSYDTMVEFNGKSHHGNVCPDCWGKHYG